MTAMTALDPALIRALDAQARVMVERYQLALEEMCERSLVDLEERGVLVTRSSSGWAMTLDASVPWGMIHERLTDTVV